MPVARVPWSDSSTTITLMNVIKSLVRVAPSAGAVSLQTYFFVASQCPLHAFPAAACHRGQFDCGRVPHWKMEIRRPYSGDGKIHRFNGRDCNCGVRSYLCAVGLERASLMPLNALEGLCHMASKYKRSRSG